MAINKVDPRLTNETYYFGQGEVHLCELVNGIPSGKWFWLVDVSSLTANSELTNITHEEAHSGHMATVRDFVTKTKMSLAMTLMNRNGKNLEIGLSGDTIITEAGTVTSEALPADLENGDTIFLENMGASSLVINDSAGTAIASSCYEFQENYGKVKFINLPTAPAPSQPFTADYEYAARVTNTILTKFNKNYALRYVGVNLAENGAPCKLDFYKISTQMATSFSLITSGDALDGMEINGSVLMDNTKPQDSLLGKFGNYQQLV